MRVARSVDEKNVFVLIALRTKIVELFAIEFCVGVRKFLIAPTVAGWLSAHGHIRATAMQL